MANIEIKEQQWRIIPGVQDILLHTTNTYLDKDIVVAGSGGMAQVIVTITPATIATVKLTNLTTEKEFTALSNENGVANIDVDEFGEFKISYQSEGAITSQRTITIAQPGKIYQISATYTTSKTYTAIIDLNNSNPNTCITYADDATTMTKGSDAWDEEIIFNNIKPCVFNDGQVAYYLDKNDITLKQDGTEANLDGTDGDVMIEFPKFAYRIYKDDNKHLYVSITNDPAVADSDSRYHYYAFSKETEGDVDHFYWGAFKGTLNSQGNLQSVVGLAPAANKNIGAFKTCAQNRGQGYTITSYFQLVAIQCLYIIKYGNLNGQSALGQGISGRSSTASDDNYGPLVTGGTTTFEAGRRMYYGNPSNTGSSADYEIAKLGHVKFAGIEDFWGNIWEWIDGLTTDSSRNIITNWDYNHHTEQEDFTFVTGLTANKSGYVNDVAGTTEAGFMNTGWSGSSSTYFCDDGGLCAGCVLLFGGRWNIGADCGPFGLYADGSASSASARLGARLMYLG